MIFFTIIEATKGKRTKLLSRNIFSKVPSRNIRPTVSSILQGTKKVVPQQASTALSNNSSSNTNSSTSTTNSNSNSTISSSSNSVSPMSNSNSSVPSSSSPSPMSSSASSISNSNSNTVSPMSNSNSSGSSSWASSISNVASRIINTTNPKNYHLNSFSAPTQTASAKVSAACSTQVLPTEVYADPSKVIAYEFVQGLSCPSNLWNKILFGVPVKNTPYILGRLCSTKPSYINKAGRLDYNEVFNTQRTIKGGPGTQIQYVGEPQLYHISLLKPYNSFYHSLDPVLEKDISYDVSVSCTAFNLSTDNNQGAIACVMVGLMPPLMNFFLLK